jgi:hypothetical protein
MNENQDLLDLCRLNLMEENVKESPAVDRDTTLKAIDYKRRQLATRIINNAPEPEPGVMDDHIKQNTRDGVYPWTDTEVEIVEEE